MNVAVQALGAGDGSASHGGGGDLDRMTDQGEAGRAKPKKAPNAFRTISEVADELHIPQHVLRFWETKFPQVKPLKRGGGRRYYRPDDILLLRRISDLLYIQGYTIKGVQRLLREGGGKLSDDIPPATPDEQAEAEAERGLAAADTEPQLPMPGLAPSAPLRAGRPVQRPAAHAGAHPDARDDDEAVRLRAVLSATLEELEALRALLP
jgi:DNA-binding transcriptional MerR regulator